MALPLSSITNWFLKLNVTEAIDILVVAFLIYQLIMVVKGTRAAHILGGIGMVLLVYLFAAGTNLELLRSILGTLFPYAAIAVIVIFQSEIRRTLARMGRSRWLGLSSQFQRRDSTDDILLAISRLAADKFGALIVVERDTGLRTFIESGVAMNASLSRDLLLSIFQPGGALHDGAVIVQGDRIAAAACFLPLSVNPLLASKLGTRHRAAIGITEEADCISLVVSEETGQISVCAFGEIESEVTIARVEERLAKHLGRKSKREQPPKVLRAPQRHPGAPSESNAEGGWKGAGQQ
jgi:diadenylate cyclase